MVFYSAIRRPNSGYIYEHNHFVLPDNYMLNFDVWCTDIQPKIKEGMEKYKWEDKEEVVFWRGKLTGMHLDKFPVGVAEHNPSPEKVKEMILEDPRLWQRVYLCFLSALHPEIIDSKINDEFPLHSQLMAFKEHGWHKHEGFKKAALETYKLITQKFKDAVLREDMVSNQTMTTMGKVSITDHLKYKYLISVDGNTCAWQRVPWIMLSGSVLLLVETDMEEWFYADIIPYFHYVPIKNDLSDLVQ